MPVTDRDIAGLVYFARRLRDETYGCKTWDEHGTDVIFAREYAGKNLRIALEEVIAHACDPTAKTPAAITRGFRPSREASSPKPVICETHGLQHHGLCPSCRADQMLGDHTQPAARPDPDRTTTGLAACRAALRGATS